MRILAVAEFDPCHVLAGHRAALRALGHDYRTAVHTIFKNADYGDLGTPDYHGVEQWAAVKDFAESADVLQFHPCIGQPWSYMELDAHFHDADLLPYGSLDWKTVAPCARRIAYFHGSRNAWHNRVLYAKHYRERGFALWTSTLDYAYEMGATYAPPVARDLGDPVPLRGDDEPLVIAHTPTDPTNCHTSIIIAMCQQLGIPLVYSTGKRHSEAIAVKRCANAGFDHLRGAFSVNTIENCSLGLAPLVALLPKYRELFKACWDANGVRLPFMESAADLRKWVDHWQEHPEYQRDNQRDSHEWVQRCFNPKTVGTKLEAAYRALL